nr:hypothetical protein BaRGS_014129 [Batillaria attramentaria]
MNAEISTVASTLDHYNEYFPDRPAFIFLSHDLTHREVLTFGELYLLSTRFAARMKSRRVKRDDRVVILLPNCPERAVVEAGVQYFGAVSVNGRCQSKDLSDLVYILNQSKATTLIIDSDMYEQEWKSLKQKYVQLYGPDDRLTAITIPNLRLCIHVKRPERNEEGFLADLKTRWTQQHTAMPPQEPRHVNCVMVTAGGQDGRLPKLVVHTHRNIIAASRVITPRGDTPHVTYFMDHPMGVTRVLMDERAGPPTKGYPKFVYEAIRTEKCERAVLHPAITPPLFRYFKDREAEDLCISRLRMVWLSGEKITKKEVEATLKISNLVIVSYVTSEQMMSSMMAVTDASQYKDLCVGRAVHNAQVRVVGDDSNPVKPGVRGMLEIRSPLTFKEYLDDPKLTMQHMTPDGFFRTGDFGWVDHDGLLYVESRIGDCFTFAGTRVNPGWLEAQVQKFYGVEAALVVVTQTNADNLFGKQDICVCIVVDDESTTAALTRKKEEEEDEKKKKKKNL